MKYILTWTVYTKLGGVAIHSLELSSLEYAEKSAKLIYDDCKEHNLGVVFLITPHHEDKDEQAK